MACIYSFKTQKIAAGTMIWNRRNPCKPEFSNPHTAKFAEWMKIG